MKKIYNLLLSLIFLYILTPLSYAADWNDIFRPIAAQEETDLLVKYVLEPIGNNNIMGTVSQGANPIALVSGVFLTGIMVLAGILFVYNIVTSLTNTAIQGEMLGKKGALSYTTLRNVVGIGMLIPLGTNAGFSAVQKIVLYLATQGVYLADMAWEKYVEYQPLESQIVVNNALRAKVLLDLKPIALFATCANHFNLEPGYGGSIGFHSKQYSGSGNATTPTGKKWGASVTTVDEGKISKIYSSNDVGQQNGMNGVEPSLGSKELITYISYGFTDEKEKKPNLSDLELCGKFQLSTQRIFGAGQSYYTAVPLPDGSGGKSHKGGIAEINTNSNFVSQVANISDLDEVKHVVENAHKNLYISLARSTDGSSGGVVKDKISNASQMGAIGDIGAISKLVDILTQKDSKVEDVAAEMDRLAGAYQNYIVQIARDGLGALKNTTKGEDLRAAMHKDGIAAAGAWYWAIVSQGSNLSDIINSPPVITGIQDPMGILDGRTGNTKTHQKYLNSTSIYKHDEVANNKNGSSGSSDPNDKRLLQSSSNLNWVLQNARSKIDEALRILLPEQNYNESGRNIDSGNYVSNKPTLQFLKQITGATANPITKGDFQFKSSTNPVVTVHLLGKKVLWWVEGMFDRLLSNETKNSTEAKAENSGLMFIGMPIILSLLLPAIIMVYYIPLLPLVLWIGILIGWITMVIQAVFGAPLWMLAHLTPDKESFVGRQGQGYMLILGLFIRPILMVIGFITSVTLLIPVGKLINAFFGFAATTVMGGTGFMWILGLLAVMFIYAMVLQNTIKKIYSLMHVIPDSLLQWFGGQDQKVLGEYASGIEQGSQQGLNSLSGGVSSLGHGMMRAGGMGHGAGGSKGGQGGFSAMLNGLGSAMEGIQETGRTTGFQHTQGLVDRFSQGFGGGQQDSALDKINGNTDTYGAKVANDTRLTQDDYRAWNRLKPEERQELQAAQERNPNITSYVKDGRVRPIMPSGKEGSGNEYSRFMNSTLSNDTPLNQQSFEVQKQMMEARQELTSGGGNFVYDLKSGDLHSTSEVVNNRNGSFIRKPK